jgi:hypothetical protein
MLDTNGPAPSGLAVRNRYRGAGLKKVAAADRIQMR